MKQKEKMRIKRRRKTKRRKRIDVFHPHIVQYPRINII